MSKVAVETKLAPKPVGSYSQAIIMNKLVFTSGQIPINPLNGELIQDNINMEVNQVFKNLDAILCASGSSIEKIIKTTVFLTDISLFQEINKIFIKYFPKDPPARSVVEVSALPMNARIEIEAIGLIL
tara:strand:- start:66 stop:449 length:384 start_codon:yes stop_codon:yes gene_type:complete